MLRPEEVVTQKEHSPKNFKIFKETPFWRYLKFKIGLLK